LRHYSDICLQGLRKTIKEPLSRQGFEAGTSRIRIGNVIQSIAAFGEKNSKIMAIVTNREKWHNYVAAHTSVIN
jgi:hypothetical protein